MKKILCFLIAGLLLATFAICASHAISKRSNTGILVINCYTKDSNGFNKPINDIGIEVYRSGDLSPKIRKWMASGKFQITIDRNVSYAIYAWKVPSAVFTAGIPFQDFLSKFKVNGGYFGSQSVNLTTAIAGIDLILKYYPAIIRPLK